MLELAREADVDVGEVYRVDASRRTTGANAYVNGLGHTKRVVLYDNLIEGLPRDQVLQVVAHELGHQHHRDLLRGLVWLAIVAPAGTLPGAARSPSASGAARASATRTEARGRRRCRRWRCRWRSSRSGSGSPETCCRGQVEASADSFSLDLTRNPAAHIALERALAVRNVSDPDPPAVYALAVRHPSHDPRADRDRRGVGARALS